MLRYFYTVVAFWILSISPTECSCQWPDAFRQSNWTDSLKGELAFTDTGMSGWVISIRVASGGTQTVNAWECLYYNETESFLVMRSVSTFEYFVSTSFRAFLCLELVKITDHSYRHYIRSPVQRFASFDRVGIVEDTGDPLAALDTAICPAEHGATIPESQILVKTGFEDAARVTCPYSLLADYSFTYADTDSSTPCTTADTAHMGMCGNSSQINVTASTCATNPLYSDSGVSACMDVVMSGGFTFVTLYNTVGGADSTQFSCVALSDDGASMSVTPDHCKRDQNATAVPLHNSGNQQGAVMTLAIDGAPCPPCVPLVAPTEGSVVVTTDGAVTMATFTCNAGFSLSGSDTRVCQIDGTWSGNPASCSCPIPATPSNGTVTLSTDGLTATYSCDVGNVLDGPISRSCDTVTNTWSDKPPACKGCLSLTAPSNGAFVQTSHNNGTTTLTTYSCINGATLSGDVNRTCNIDTTWTAADPTCVKCPGLGAIPSGTINITGDGVTSVAVYTCAVGYFLTGVNTSLCTTSGNWDSNQPSCSCVDPASPSNGSVSVTLDHTEAVYTCDTMTSLSGERVRTCATDGTGWSGKDPFCITCPAVLGPNNGTADVTSNGTLTSVTYTCNAGSTLSGTSTATCFAGSWSSATPTCSLCADPPSLTSGSFSFTTNGTVTYGTIQCDVGTTVSGDVNIACDLNGNWDISSGNISCVTCDPLPSSSGSTYSLSSNGTTTYVDVTCETGYQSTGSTTVECGPDGTWNLTALGQTCVEVATDANSGSTDSSSTDLLPAVISLAVVAALLLAALVGAAVYIKKLKSKSATTAATTANETKNGPLPGTYMFPSNNAPRDHQHHVMGGLSVTPGHTRPPSEHRAHSSVGFGTPRTMRSAVSDGSLNLQLIKEGTELTFTPEHAAPWKQSKQSVATTSQIHTNGFPPVQDKTNLTGNMTPRKKTKKTKKKSFGKKMISHNSVNSHDVTTHHDVNTESDVSENERPPPVQTAYESSNVAVKKRISARSQIRWNAPTGGLVPPLNLGESQRATTPINHPIEVASKDLFHGTPRSGAFATVQ